MISFKTIRSLCLDFVIFFIPAVVLWLALPKLLGILLPFILGYFLYLITKPLNKLLTKHLPSSFGAFLSLLLISLALVFLLWILFSHLAREIASFSKTSSIYRDTLPFISKKLSRVSSSRADIFIDFFDKFHAQISNILFRISLWVIEFVKNIPGLLITVFTTFFTAFFLLKDSESIYSGAKYFFGEKLCLKFTDIKNSFLDVILSYIKAQFLIESIIFTVLFAGFSFLKIRYALILAFFTAVVDVFPILGTGTILVPASLFYFLTDNPVTGWGLLTLYAVSILTRQLCEPKIIGSKLGIHPLMTIFSIYAGMKLFGFWGLLLGPIATILIKNLFLVRKT